MSTKLLEVVVMTLHSTPEGVEAEVSNVMLLAFILDNIPDLRQSGMSKRGEQMMLNLIVQST